MMRRYVWKTIGAVVISATALLPILHAEDAPEATQEEETEDILSFSEESAHTLSASKIAKIKDLLEIYINRQEDLSSKHVVIRLEQEISRAIPPLVPYRKLIKKKESELDAEARTAIENLYKKKQYLPRITAAATREAAKKYPLYKNGDKVKIYYKQGHHNYMVEGILYESNARFIQIGDRQIPVNILSPETRLCFNPTANEEARQAYIQLQVRRLATKQLNETRKYHDKLLLEIDEQNEKNGYIFNTSTQRWMTAKEYLAELLVPARQKQQEAKKLQEQKEKQRLLEEQKAGTYTDEEYNAVYKKLNEAQKKVSETYSGIDADPGYEGVGWDASYNDLRVILSRVPGVTRNTFIDPKTEEEKKQISIDGEILKYAEGVPSTICFYFATSEEQIVRLSKVDYIYGTLTQEDLDKEVTRFTERYGKSKEGASSGEKAILDKIVKEKTAGEQQISWTGKTTSGTLYFTYDKESNSFVNVHFVKERTGKE